MTVTSCEEMFENDALGEDPTDDVFQCIDITVSAVRVTFQAIFASYSATAYFRIRF